MRKNNEGHLKANDNKKFQIVILQATKEPINITISKLAGKVVTLSCICFILFSTFLFIDNKNLNETVRSKNDEMQMMNVRISDQGIENRELKFTLKEKNRVIEEKTFEIQAEIENINKFEQTIRDLIGLGQGGSEIVSRSMGPRFDEEINGNDEYIAINEKLNEYENMVDKYKEEMNDLYIEVEDRLDYLDRLPNFFPTVGTISSKFGYRRNPFTYSSEFHHGVDIANYSGTSIVSAGKGIVLEAGYKSALGRYIIINHGYGFKTKYAHLSKIDVSVDDEVEKGQAIGKMGNTGQSTGPHLHFEIRYNGEAINPLSINEICN